MYFLYLKTTGEISVPMRLGKPDERTINKEPDCGIGGGVKWHNVDLFYADDGDFPDDFQENAPLGKYYVKNDEIKKTVGWKKPKEIEEWP